MSKPIIIQSVRDFAQVPSDRLPYCLKDFIGAVEMMRQKISQEKPGIGKPEPFNFQWLDDGSADSVYLEDMPNEVDIIPANNIRSYTIIDLPLQGLKIIECPVTDFESGYFLETFNTELFKTFEVLSSIEISYLDYMFAEQDTIRGLYYQSNPPQSQFVTCLSSSAMLVALDIRPESKTFGLHYAIELRHGRGKVLFVPSGFALGCLVTGRETCLLSFVVCGERNPQSVGRIDWSDRSLGIPWSFTGSPLVGQELLPGQSFTDFKRNNPFE